MAEAAEPSGAIELAIERYGAIEQAYRDQVWPTVLQEGRMLLDDLAGGSDRISRGLRQRLLLLLGHTHLHGLGDREAARDFYGTVLTDDAEDSLRRIAQEGFQQCESPPEPEGPEPPLAPMEVTPEQAPAMPWLEASGAGPLIPEVVEEPELIELHQADPDRAEEVEVKVRATGEAVGDREDQDLRRGLLRVVLR
jgi:hypothetical protein